MKRTFFLVLLFQLISAPSRADLFGVDVAVLSQILTNTVMQLGQLREILGSSEKHLELIREINRGINDSLQILRRVNPNQDPGIYGDWDSTPGALERLTQIYGAVPNSPEARIQRDLDLGVAEAVSFNNNFYKYSNEVDGIGEQIQNQSHHVSPGGAAKLTAQALGLVVQGLNQNLRAQSTMLKLHAQDAAVRNRESKLRTRQVLESGWGLRDALRSEPVTFRTPRF